MEDREDLIFIKGLICYGKYGVSEQERFNPQKIIIDADLMTTQVRKDESSRSVGNNVSAEKSVPAVENVSSVKRASEHDDLTQTVDYGHVCHLINEYISTHSFLLIETLAERLAEYILSAVPKLVAVRLTVQKPEAPIGLSVENVGIQIIRRKSE